jgi:hypothetical protein
MNCYYTVYCLTESMYSVFYMLQFLPCGMTWLTGKSIKALCDEGIQENEDPPFLTSALNGCEWLALCPSSFTSREGDPGTHWIGPHSLSGHCGEEKNLLPLLGIKPDHSACGPQLHQLSYPGSIKYSKVKLSLCRPWRPLGLREVEAPTFSDIRLIDGGKVVSPTRRPLFLPPGRFLVLISVRG